METRKLRVFTDEDVKKIQDTVSAWRTGEGYEDVEGYCKSSTIDEIEKNDFILTPGRYVGFADDDDGINFDQNFNELLKNLDQQIDEGNKLESEIRSLLKRINKK